MTDFILQSYHEFPVRNKNNKKSNKSGVIKSVCDCNDPKFNQYVDFCLNCGLPSKEE